MKQEIQRLEKEKAERKAKKANKTIESPKHKKNNNKVPVEIEDPIEHYLSFSKKPVDFRKLHAHSESDSRSYSSSASFSESSDDFPSPTTPAKRHDNDLFEKVKNLQRKVSDMENQIKKIKQNRKV